jgi:hypothetical protein
MSLYLLPLTGLSLFAFGMGLFFGIAAQWASPGNRVLPATMAFTFVGIRWSFVTNALAMQERRIQAIKQRLRDREPPADRGSA